MSFFPSRKVFLQIGNFDIRWYAVLILTGALIAYLFMKKDMAKTKYMNKNDFLDDLFILALWTGIVGARIWFCLFFDAKYYFSNPIEILKIYDGGLAIHGGIIFGAIAAYIFCKKRNTSFLKTADCVLPNVLIAQAIGRWGNFINQECHGPMVDESYFDGILSFIKEGMHIGGNYYMPMFFYESVLCLIGFILIRLVIKKYAYHKRGDLAYCYMMWYGLVRLYIESKRTDALLVGSLKIAQIISIVLIVAGILGYIGLFNKFIKKQKPVIIFDFDGTIINTDQSVLKSFEGVFKNHNRENDFTQEVQDYVLGPSLHEAFGKLFPNENTEELIKEYKDIQEGLSHLNKLVPNIDEVLKTLKEEGYHIGIVSTRAKDGIITRLKAFDLDKYIDDIFGLYETVKLKPDPEAVINIIKKNKWNRDDVVYIGDSIGDVLCGFNYGAYTVGYIERESRKDAMENSDANVCVYDVRDLLKIVKEDRYFTYDGK